MADRTDFTVYNHLRVLFINYKQNINPSLLETFTNLEVIKTYCFNFKLLKNLTLKFQFSNKVKYAYT